MNGLLSPGHVVILLTIVLLVFGTKRLPELGRSLGSGMREFKDSVTTDRPEIAAAPHEQAAEAVPLTEPTGVTQPAGRK